MSLHCIRFFVTYHLVDLGAPKSKWPRINKEIIRIKKIQQDATVYQNFISYLYEAL